LALGESIHGEIEDEQVAQPFYISAAREDGAAVQESTMSDLRKPSSCGQFDRFVSVDE
jgi:hypothetical protein